MKEIAFIEKMISDLEARLIYLKNEQEGSQKIFNPDYKTTIILDAGHGGMNPEGMYVTAPAKMWKHEKGMFHEGRTFYEGIFNRLIVKKLIQRFEEIGMPYYELAHEWKDTPLHTRSWRANQYHLQLKQEGKQSVLFSIHGNAYNNTNVNGWSVFIAPNASRNSKILATNLAKGFQDIYPDIPLRTEYAGEYYFTGNFHILKKTQMPAILSENLFFTNYDNAVLMMTEKFQNHLVDIHTKTALFAQKLAY